MKGSKVLLTCVALISFLGCGQTKVLTPHLSSLAANEWSAEEHQVAADMFEEEAVRLETKVAHLEQRVERLNQKSYLDSKGFKRQGWRRLMGAHRVEIQELREQMAWHYGEAARFNAMPPSEEREILGEGKKS